MRSGSLPSSPSPLGVSSPSSALGISIPPPNYFNGPLPASEPEQEEAVEEQPTSPIPDFILTAGSRTSFIGYGRRKSRGENENDGKEDQNG